MQPSPMEVIHRRAVLAAGLLVVFTVITVTGIQLFGLGKKYEPQAETVASAELLFEDRSDGVVAVIDAASGAELIQYGENEGVFVRSVMRGVARQRRLRGQGEAREVPVRLAQFADGQLWLSDPANDVQIYLGAFGPDNVDAFSEILQLGQQIAGAADNGEAS